MASKQQFITAKDLYRFEFITHLELSPDGEYVIYSQQRVDKATEKKYQNLWVVSTKGGAPRQFTFGDQVDTMPKWSPDGKSIAFLSNRGDEEQPQIYLIPFHGGDARQLTDIKGTFIHHHSGPNTLSWSPDGSQLLFEFIKMDKDAEERLTDPRKKDLGIVARHITRTFYKFDGLGYLPKERTHLWLVNPKSGKTTQLTNHDVFDEWGPVWSPDSQKIAFISNRHPDPDMVQNGEDIYIMNAKPGAKMRKVATPHGTKMKLAFSPDAKNLAYLGAPGSGHSWENYWLWTVPTNGKEKAVCLTEKHDFTSMAATIADVIPTVSSAPIWSKDAQTIYVKASEHGNEYLRAVDVKTKKVEDVIAETGVVSNYNFDHGQNKLAYYWGTLSDPNQIMLHDLTTGESKQLTKVNRWLTRLDLGTIEEVWFKGPDKNDLQGWILKPPGFRANKKYPSLLEIHGGPMLQYGNHFMHEFYFLAAQGYVVYFSNPRGGMGYGRKNTTSIINDFGGRDYQDVIAWTNYVQKKPYIDKKRMGVTGGSYGGYMTAWIIGKTTRFAAAIAQRAVTNWVSMLGSSDVNWSFDDWFDNKQAFHSTKVMLNIWKQSPMSLMGPHVKTPTKVIHSQMDQRVEQEQGEQLYAALKYLGVDTELVLFPDTPHGLSRMGRTDRRIERLNHILVWFDKYLK